ncbi:hypothetical protein CCUS01_14428 [Colletotrichum cuscutae]|uniref:Uncharacterized protein n=1 Tax=Colletotrichum cuscutae TaxID=1209917 RepID=A0AAJ0DKZ4_9PEZI|nr:hypothetical protein CCUS01_14428 [Colletotrichum cuscutae]
MTLASAALDEMQTALQKSETRPLRRQNTVLRTPSRSLISPHGAVLASLGLSWSCAMDVVQPRGEETESLVVVAQSPDIHTVTQEEEKAGQAGGGRRCRVRQQVSSIRRYLKHACNRPKSRRMNGTVTTFQRPRIGVTSWINELRVTACSANRCRRNVISDVFAPRLLALGDLLFAIRPCRTPYPTAVLGIVLVMSRVIGLFADACIWPLPPSRSCSPNQNQFPVEANEVSG